ncbi:MAG: glucose-6-phosphate isomerase, partial [Pseudobutyrivibrio sp.]|nr:glucose-6-phosphate isomerase [Pseudobutyrivibrio sp.]
MTEWKNFDKLESYKTLQGLKNQVELKSAMAGANGAKRVAEYVVPMSNGMVYNFASKQVDDTVLDALAKLADEAQLVDKYAALYNGEVINTGEKRLVLHQLTRGQL